MICTATAPERPSNLTQKAHPARASRSLRDNDPSDYPLLDWLILELEEADGLDRRTAVRAARRVLDQAYGAVDRLALNLIQTETSA